MVTICSSHPTAKLTAPVIRNELYLRSHAQNIGASFELNKKGTACRAPLTVRQMICYAKHSLAAFVFAVPNAEQAISCASSGTRSVYPRRHRRARFRVSRHFENQTQNHLRTSCEACRCACRPFVPDFAVVVAAAIVQAAITMFSHYPSSSFLGWSAVEEARRTAGRDCNTTVPPLLLTYFSGAGTAKSSVVPTGLDYFGPDFLRVPLRFKPQGPSTRVCGARSG